MEVLRKIAFNIFILYLWILQNIVIKLRNCKKQHSKTSVSGFL